MSTAFRKSLWFAANCRHLLPSIAARANHLQNICPYTEFTTHPIWSDPNLDCSDPICSNPWLLSRMFRSCLFSIATGPFLSDLFLANWPIRFLLRIRS